MHTRMHTHTQTHTHMHAEGASGGDRRMREGSTKMWVSGWMVNGGSEDGKRKKSERNGIPP